MIFAECVRYEAVQKSYPGTLVVLVQATKLSCDNLNPDTSKNGIILPDWAIGVIVAGCVALAGGAIGLGIALRNKQLRDESVNLDRKQST